MSDHPLAQARTVGMHRTTRVVQEREFREKLEVERHARKTRPCLYRTDPDTGASVAYRIEAGYGLVRMPYR